jgi:HK97 family phage major capsid protein
VWTPPAYTYSSPLLDVVGKVSTSSNAVSYVKWTPNPQAAASVVAEGALKPEAAMTAAAQSVSLVTWAHWKEITRQALEDVPQIRSTVEGRLRQGLVRAIEDSIAANLIAATLPAVAAPAGSNLLTAIRMGVGTVQAAGYSNPNAVLLNPADYATLDILVMNGANGSPVTQSGFWGLKPIASTSVPLGTAWVGDFSAGVTLFTRGSAAIYLTDSHADNFIRNVLLLLAETRGLAVVGEPAAIAECTVTP